MIQGADKVFLEGGLHDLQDYIQSCEESYFITFTSKRRYESITLSSELKKTMSRVNRALFGPAFSRHRRIWLATFVVHELTIDQGLHAHALVGVPNGSLSVKANPCPLAVPDLILNTWIKMDDRGKRGAKAQDAQAIYNFAGALGYATKRLNNLSEADHLDVLNTTMIPDVTWLSEAKCSDNREVEKT